ncbi:DUF4249 domain-containing protein [Aquiflexum sp.]|uniref:DUF4249 domain-containing protein n=1 Tax=Aquiflexum sp. TaxID=1872584 RepID=UPI00359399F9
MVKKSYYFFWCLPVILSLLSGCRDPFEPEIRFSDFNLLVVEGFIETGSEESILKLSRTGPIRGEEEFRVESGAMISLNAESGERWDFIEIEPGMYSLTGNFDHDKTYRLQILLNNNHEYLSDPLIPIESPEISDMGFNRNEDGVQIYVSTQGNQEAVHFLWGYEETWMFRPPFPSPYFYNPDTKDIEFRKPEDQVGRCWSENKVNRIVLENSGRFTNNIINQKEVVFIPNLSEKLMQRYSLNIRQMAISREAFEFWEIMRKNTEDIGGIFSPLPSLIRGNIHAVNTSHPDPIGFVSMGKSGKKRLYINVQELTPWQVFIPDYTGCAINNDTIPPQFYELEFGGPNFVPVVEVVEVLTILGYQGAPRRCADCTLRGSNVRPDFWED